ncbi:hypothetical protein [Planctomicrobium piriforme]|uniref:Uncharacterized protein n=1 Tax=Planctomicrobium piriforme TaxID=1576369 RepID=A0A1I3TFU0_9PLAN|nr:hypothetical protein [Planctomicrobium piriforme]SFJ69785.1 hypothetical protein SAMN05421753_13013 [Planctomicrobium piriforme]
MQANYKTLALAGYATAGLGLLAGVCAAAQAILPWLNASTVSVSPHLFVIEAMIAAMLTAAGFVLMVLGADSFADTADGGNEDSRTGG